MNYRNILLTGLLTYSILIDAQPPQSTLVINSSLTGTQVKEARDAIFLMPGFSYRAESGTSFKASINPSLQIPYYSEGSQVVDPNTRTLNTSLPVGTLPGNLTVDRNGAANYDIPIFVSPGTAGMQPQISIIYNSHIEDGLLGRGWEISGLSAIKRVPQDIFHEGSVMGVTLQSTDRFALDSNRLVLMSGNYGADGSIYATELETFVRITAHGIAGTGPDWFEVETKDGKTIEYGNTPSSKVEAPGSATVYQWRLNKIKDRSGNFMVFSYFETAGESYIEKIVYTGNDGAGITPYNTLKFSYGTRTDINYRYVGGSKIPISKILTSITMETVGSDFVREYQFRYVMDFYTHLNEIVEFGKDRRYYNSTSIGWGSPASQLPPIDAFSNGKSNSYYLGDFNGDGRTDFVVTEKKTSYTSSDKWQLYLASGGGTTFIKINEGYLSGNFKEFIVSDVDGNGRSDLYWKNVNTVTYQCNPHPCGIEMNIQNDSLGIKSKTEIDTTLSALSSESMLFNPPPPPPKILVMMYAHIPI